MRADRGTLWTMVASLLVVVVAIAGACVPPTTDVGVVHVPIDTLKDRSHCQDQSSGFVTVSKKNGFITDCLRRLRLARAFWPEMVRQGELHSLIPEFHDEQRLPNSREELGPMAMIFASPALGGFTDERQFAEHYGRPETTGGGVLVAVVMLDEESKDPAPLGSVYDDLGLQRGLNCVWVSYRTSPTPLWAAYVNWPTKGRPCSPAGDRRDLAVVRTDLRSMTRSSDDVPAVARFTWSTTGQPLLGVRCAIGWCDIGPRPTAGVAALTVRSRIKEVVNDLAAADRAKVLEALGGSSAIEVPGWHDEQALLEFDANGKPVPGTMWATVIPVHRSYRTMGAIVNVDSGPVALLYVHGDPTPRYAGGTWRLRQGLNVVRLDRSTGALRALVTNRDGTDMPWMNIHRHPHYDAPVIATARFRWASSDDGIWVACGQACCRVDGEL